MTGGKAYWEDPTKVEIHGVVLQVEAEGREILLDVEALFPPGGGQEGDEGWVEIDGTKHAARAEKRGDHVAHVLDPPFRGNTGSKARVFVNMARRHALMRAHTAQHLFSAIALAKHDAHTVSVSIKPDEATIRVGRTLTWEALGSIMLVAWQAIASKKQVSSLILSKDEVAQRFHDTIRGAITDQDQARVIIIDDIDVTCCGGTHVCNTSDIGMMVITKTRKKSEFVVATGLVAFEHCTRASIEALQVQHDHDTQDSLASIMRRVSMERDRSSATVEDLLAMIVDLLVNDVTTTIHGVKVHELHGLPVPVKTILGRLKDLPAGHVLIIHEGDKTIHVVSSSQHIPANQLVERIKETAEGKGGGNPRVAQLLVERGEVDVYRAIKDLIEREGS